jgi:hypothetical protein
MFLIGATTALASHFLVETHLGSEDPASPVDNPKNETDLSLYDILGETNEPLSGRLDLDAIMATEVNTIEVESGAAHAQRTRDTMPSHLSKIWRIDLETAERTLETNSQHVARAPSETLSQNFGTNERMLR